MKSIDQNIDYVATVWIVEEKAEVAEGNTFDVRVWDEWNNCSDEPLEAGRFKSWDEAQGYIERLYDEHPEVYFVRDLEKDTFL